MRDDDHVILESIYAKILNEAIPLSIAKKSLGKRHFLKNYKDIFLNRIFGTKHRIILPFKISQSFRNDVFHNKDMSPYPEIHDFLFLSGRGGGRPDPHDKYAEDLKRTRETDPEEHNRILEKSMKEVWLNTFYIDIDSYVEGYVYRYKRKENGMIDYQNKDPNHKIRIGKLLQHYGREDLLKRFKEDKNRQLGGEYVIVISRHPYDIAGASTDRNWTSCIDRQYPPIVYKDKKEKDKDKSYYNKEDIKKWSEREFEREKCYEDLDGLVAYLVPKDELMKDEKVALRKPISRIIMNRFSNERLNGYYIPDDGMQGVESDDFKRQVLNWMDDNHLTDRDDEEDYY